MRVVCLFAAVVVVAGCVHRIPPPHAWDLVGTVRGENGTPISGRVFVCVGIRGAYGGERCSNVDSLGNYAIDSTVPFKLGVSVMCEVVRGPFRKRLFSDTTDAGPPVAVHRDFTVDPSGCDPRPLRTMRGEFRGHWVPGFESSDFTPCPNDGWHLPGDSVDASGAWATVPPSAERGVRIPDVPIDSQGYPHFYVRWRGTITGPGHYGHMNASAFDLTVDRVLELRAPSARDCQ